MNQLQIAEIKAIAIRLAYEINPTQKISDLLADAHKIFEYISR